MFQVPDNESGRIAALVNYGILDSDVEDTFDRVTRIAANVFKVPIAAISLIDATRQWFKSSVGLGMRETSRDISFCTHAILESDVFVIPNAPLDQRFAANPLVTGSPNIRFYAGALLSTPDGYAVGTMCIMDRVSRPEINDDQKRILQDLAGIVIDLMELRVLRRQLKLSPGHRKT